MNTVDLRHAPAERWRLSEIELDQARELMTTYCKDLGLAPHVSEMLGSAAEGFIRPDHWQELAALASATDIPLSAVVVGNLYYDLFKVVLHRTFGCTAFTVETDQGILHARNLDWWTENAMLAKYSTVTRFIGAPAGEFTTVGWPGFIGAFSGVAQGRFAVTLNAVLSLEPPQMATPVVFLLRTVLEEARSYGDALQLLCETPIPCDCLLLLSGTEPGEMVVIERTPSRHAVRKAVDGFIAVTNGYLLLETDGGSAPGTLKGTSCGRFDRVAALVQGGRPKDPLECLRYLSDPDVRMDMTVQQMVFRASTGDHWLG